MSIRTLSRLAMILVLPLTLAACGGDDDGTGPTGGTGGNAVPTIGSGLTPTISWTGGNARNITVTRMENGQPTTSVWMVNATAPSTGFSSPVTYGQLPSGGAQLTAATPLQAGATYRFTLATVDNRGGYRDVSR